MDRIERLARHLCEEAGQDPERLLREYGRSSFSYPAWEDFRPAAKKLLGEYHAILDEAYSIAGVPRPPEAG
jgi:hypothetical protein